MYRPALVIGLGGTGVLTLRHLKAQLLSSRERRMPDHVKLIALDTYQDPKRSAQIEGKIQIAALRTELDPGQYFWIGGDVYEYVQEISKGQHPQIGSWFQANAYLQSLPRAVYTLETGAAQLRQFGRLAIFHDVDAPARSSIFSLLNRAIGEVRQFGQITTLDVFLVASVAGGTGAGMFVDIAYLVRKIAYEEHNRMGVRLRGFLVLPEAFSAIPGGVKPQMRARSFACMRENKRFMVDFMYELGYPMYYHSTGEGGVWRSRIREKLFDTLYHIDGQSQNNPLTDKLPEYGVTAAIADAIAAMLVQSTEGGENVYDRHATNVMSARNMGVEAIRTTSFDSAVGAFSIILPMHHISDWLAHRLSLEGLKQLLALERFDKDGYPLALSPDANAEAPGVRGRDVSDRFLDYSDVLSLRTGDRVANTPFIRELRRVALSYRPNDPTVPTQLASQDAQTWQNHLDPPGGDPAVEAIRQRVQQTLNSRLIDEVPANQRGESAGTALERIRRGVEAYKGRYLGREDPRTGERVGGQYRMDLQEYARIHLERYRLMLEIECENILNGGLNPDDPPSVQRGGKLGYLIDFLKGLEEILGRFLEALSKARDIRQARGGRQAATDAAQAARQELEEKPGGLFGGRRRHAYLDAEQQLIDIEKSLIVEDVVRNLANEMLQHTQRLREDAESWAKTLGIGPGSLYGLLLQSEAQIRSAIAAENEVPVRQIVWDSRYLDQLYEKYAKELRPGLDDFLSRFNWRHERRRVGVREEFGFQIYLQTPGGVESRPGRENQVRNLDMLLSSSREIFAGVWDQESVLGYLMKIAYPDPNALGDLLAAKGDVLLQAGGQTQVPANYLHVAYGNDPTERAYLDAVKRRLQDRTGARGNLNEIVNSADRFSLRLVHTLDLIPLSEVSSYRRSEAAYWAFAGEMDESSGIRGRLPRETLHVFPAEVNATRFESRIATSRLRIRSRALHNDVVLQLEDIEKFKLFARCWAFGLIHKAQEQQEVGATYNTLWRLDLPERSPDRRTVQGPEPPMQIYLTRPRPGDPDILEAMMVWNYQGRDVREHPYQPIPYADNDPRVQQALEITRDKVVQERLSKKAYSGNEPAIFSSLANLPEKDRLSFQKLWVEREFLEERQEVLRQEIGSLAQAAAAEDPKVDAYIALYLALDEDISSLNVLMDGILSSTKAI